MKLSEFKRAMSKASKRLNNELKDNDYCYKYVGICYCVTYGLGFLPNNNSIKYLHNVFQPDFDAGEYWLGPEEESCLGLRQIALQLFTEYMINERLYLNLKGISIEEFNKQY